MAGDGEILLIQVISERTEYLVGRVDDLHDTVSSVLANMITKGHCDECRAKWVPRAWAKPVMAFAVALAFIVGMAGDALDLAQRVGLR